MDHTEHKNKVTTVFDLASEGFDSPSKGYFLQSARYMVEYMNLKGDERLLDVATGTGHVAIVAAPVLVNGSVTGIDISEKMLDKARAKAKALGLQNVEFLRRDMDDMGFQDGSFDLAACAFGLFFLPDIERGLRSIYRAVKPGGRLYLTSFSPGFMQPMRQMVIDRLKTYGIEAPSFSFSLMDTPEKITRLLHSTGYTDVRFNTRQLGYHLKDAHVWVDIMRGTAFRSVFDTLKEDDLKRFLADHVREVEALRDEKGIWLDVEVLFVEART